ncbi:MAG: hypothetical protein HUK12_04780 [Muribaculaceae bacterium]|nr:hypothetical protein [Muribaculaceae bacterium]
MAFTGIKAVFVDIDDTLWWFGKNSEIALKHTFGIFHLERWCSYERFHDLYRAHNGRLWERYHHGEIGKDFLLSERFRLVRSRAHSIHILICFFISVNAPPNAKATANFSIFLRPHKFWNEIHGVSSRKIANKFAFSVGKS